MSASFTPGRDLMVGLKIPVASVFTTFAEGHFVKPGRFTQPVRAISKSGASEAAFAGCFAGFLTAAPISPDPDKPVMGIQSRPARQPLQGLRVA